jgi:hypothetical protein
MKEVAMYRRVLWLVPLLFLFGLLPTVHAQTSERCFPETGFCITGRVREFWEQNGGLPVFGYPKGPQQETLIEGKVFQAQTFERNRLELHSENPRPYDVLLGRLGADRLTQQGRDPFTFPKSAAQPNCRFFPETQHNVCGDILNAWHASGLEFDGRKGKSEAENVALFGLPLSDLQAEAIEGRSYQVQWFERARFELHPENQPPYTVLLGLLGNEVAAPISPSVVPSQPTPRPLPAPSFNNCQADPNLDTAPNYPVQIIGVDKGAETVTLKNVGPDAIDLSGWHMCSVRGNQEHPIGGTLAPGQVQQFPGPPGTIWSNSESDPGALYNANGQLVSYWKD